MSQKISFTFKNGYLVYSVALSVVSKLPGIASIFFILPLVKRDLGIDGYNNLLIIFALSAIFSIPFSAVSICGRRLLSNAILQGDVKQEADAYVTTIILNAQVLVLSLAGLVLISFLNGSGYIFVAVASLPVLAAFVNVFDDLQSSYERHHISTGLRTLGQCIAFSYLYFFHEVGGIFEAALWFQLPFVISSLASLSLVVYSKSYLLSGTYRRDNSIYLSMLGVFLSDGLLILSLNFSVFWVGMRADSGFSTWYATLVRIYQSFVAPATLIIVPISGLIYRAWVKMSSLMKDAMKRKLALMAFAYGGLCALVLFLGIGYYLVRFLGIYYQPGSFVSISIVSMFGVFVTFKIYSQVVYTVAPAEKFAYLFSAFFSISGVVFFVASFILSIDISLVIYSFLNFFAIVFLLMAHSGILKLTALKVEL